MSASRCVIGVGSPHGDDQIGWLIAERLMSQARQGTRIEKVVSPLEILDRMDQLDWLGICDACHGAGRAGTWRRWTWPNVEVIQQSFAGSHDISLTSVLELARRLDRLPRMVVIWGVEIDECQPAGSMSSAVLAAVDPVTAAILLELETAQS